MNHCFLPLLQGQFQALSVHGIYDHTQEEEMILCHLIPAHSAEQAGNWGIDEILIIV
jgi:hypothetical protein